MQCLYFSPFSPATRLFQRFCRTAHIKHVFCTFPTPTNIIVNNHRHYALQHMYTALASYENCCCATVSSKINMISRAKKGLRRRLSLRTAITSFFPRFHCELISIAIMGRSGMSCSKSCDCALKVLEQMVPNSLASVSLNTIRRHARSALGTWTYIANFLTREAAEDVVKKNWSHRKSQTLFDRIWTF